MYTPRLLKITAATNIILIDIAKFNLVVLGILLHYDNWQEVFLS